jgi:DNA helicase-2/ATP-dependent DNA helicase PcrA
MRSSTAPATAPRWNHPAIHRIWRTDLANAEALGEVDPADEDIPDTGVLAKFLERVSLVADADELPEHGAGVVTMMTLHTAKGLEFPVVFVTGWEDGMFPHMRALGDPTELSEERRLAYRCSIRSPGSCARFRRS